MKVNLPGSEAPGIQGGGGATADSGIADTDKAAQSNTTERFSTNVRSFSNVPQLSDRRYHSLTCHWISVRTRRICIVNLAIEAPCVWTFGLQVLNLPHVAKFAHDEKIRQDGVAGDSNYPASFELSCLIRTILLQLIGRNKCPTSNNLRYYISKIAFFIPTKNQ